MYKEHESFISIPNSSKIWRFMSFAKFYKMLEDRALYFSPPYKLSDPWEGHLPPIESGELPNDFPVSPEVMDRMRQTMSMLVRHQVLVNCWHINEYESEALWRLYKDDGIAIQSTFGRMKESFSAETSTDILIGKIEYIDYSQTKINWGNFLNLILKKRKSFEYEQELRSVVMDMNNDGAVDPATKSLGKNIPIDLNGLVDKIYINPFCADWFLDTVRAACTRHGLVATVERSPLMEEPIKNASSQTLTDNKNTAP